MTLLEAMTTKILSLFRRDKKAPTNFFDYSSSEKKKIIERAANEAAKMKRETVKKYFASFS